MTGCQKAITFHPSRHARTKLTKLGMNVFLDIPFNQKQHLGLSAVLEPQPLLHISQVKQRLNQILRRFPFNQGPQQHFHFDRQGRLPAHFVFSQALGNPRHVSNGKMS